MQSKVRRRRRTTRKGISHDRTSRHHLQQLPEVLRRESQQVQRGGGFGSPASTPKTLVMRRDKMELFRYEPTAERTVETPVLIVYGMIGHCCPPDRSRVRNPLARGIDPFAGEIIRMVFNRQRRKAMPHDPNLATTNSVANEGKTVKIKQRSTEMTRQTTNRRNARAAANEALGQAKEDDRAERRRALLARQSARKNADAYTGRSLGAAIAPSQSTITKRTVVKREAFGRILRTITRAGRKYSYHATKGWRSQRAD
ncbi:hypothetical protein ELG69_34470 [Rhizobium leguminosarum]|nr:hypothetical protein ELG69_34470 [Rhizobium leguminosarum]